MDLEVIMLFCAELLRYVRLVATPWTVAHQAPLQQFPGKNNRVDCHALLQGMFPTQELNLGLPHYR